MDRPMFDIITPATGEHELVRWTDQGQPEFIGRFSNKVRAWLAAKELAAKEGVQAGDPPWMRLVSVPIPRTARDF